MTLFFCWLRSFWHAATRPLGNVPDAHGGLDLVHVLPALAAAAIGVHLDVGFVDLDRRALRQFGHDIDAGEGGVPAFVRVEGRDAHEPMHAALGGEIAEGIFAGDLERAGLDAGFVAELDVHDLALEAVALDPALIHAQEHVRPIAATRCRRRRS